MSTTPKSGFGLVIKTSEYTGNFEREMCAFLTGHVGECEVGNDLTRVLPNKPDFENLQQVPDEHGCHRPVSLDEIDPNNLIIFFESKPTQEQIDWIKEHAQEYDTIRRTKGRMAQFYKDAKKIEVLGFGLIEYKHSTQALEL